MYDINSVLPFVAVIENSPFESVMEFFLVVSLVIVAPTNGELLDLFFTIPEIINFCENV